MANETSVDASNAVTRAIHAAPSIHENSISYIVAGVTIICTLLLRRLSSLSLDPREPQLVRTWLPYYGFLLGLYRKGMDYFDMIRPATKPGMASVQLLNTKVYLAWSPSVIQSCMRSRFMSVDNGMAIGLAMRLFGMYVSEEQINAHAGTEDMEVPDGEDAPNAEDHALDAFLNGPPLFEMNVRALNTIGSVLNDVPPDGGLQIPNLYPWLRGNIIMATTDALFGAKNPFRSEPSLMDTQIYFEEKRAPLILGRYILKLLPGGGTLGSTKAFEAREKIHKTMMEYFAAKHDQNEDVAAMVKLTAGGWRAMGLDDNQMARFSLPLIWGATSNTPPTIFWFFTNLMLRPDLMERVCRELEGDKSDMPVLEVTLDKNRKRTGAVIDITQLDKKCPLLVSCYREAMRLGNQNMGLRMVNKEITVTDEDGTPYLLKKGNYVMWSGKTTHRSTDVWGNDSSEFDPERFMPEREANGKMARKRKQAYIPFGGGKHLCPGQHFAFAENLGFLAAIVLGFRLEGLEEENVRVGSGKVNDALSRPGPGEEGGPVNISRRPGWEHVQWSYKC